MLVTFPVEPVHALERKQINTDFSKTRSCRSKLEVKDSTNKNIYKKIYIGIYKETDICSVPTTWQDFITDGLLM